MTEFLESSWPLILPVLAIGIVIGRFALPPIGRVIELNQILASAEALGRRDHISMSEGCPPRVAAANTARVLERPEHSRAGMTQTIVRGSARTF